MKIIKNKDTSKIFRITIFRMERKHYEEIGFK